jgi:hypothetical protein
LETTCSNEEEYIIGCSHVFLTKDCHSALITKLSIFKRREEKRREEKRRGEKRREEKRREEKDNVFFSITIRR